MKQNPKNLLPINHNIALTWSCLFVFLTQKCNGPDLLYFRAALPNRTSPVPQLLTDPQNWSDESPSCLHSFTSFIHALIYL